MTWSVITTQSSRREVLLDKLKCPVFFVFKYSFGLIDDKTEIIRTVAEVMRFWCWSGIWQLLYKNAGVLLIHFQI
jgi:hypothetical protein